MPDYESTQLQILDEIGDVSVDELYHHGIKGMKWGVRRFQNKDGSLTPAGRTRQRLQDAGSKVGNAVKGLYERRKAKKQAERDAKDLKRRERQELIDRYKPIRALSDDEIQKRINRLQLEKQYKSLVSDVETISRGKKIANKILDTAIENIGTQTVTYLFGKGVNEIAKSVFKSTGDIVNPKKGQKDK